MGKRGHLREYVAPNSRGKGVRAEENFRDGMGLRGVRRKEEKTATGTSLLLRIMRAGGEEK